MGSALRLQELGVRLAYLQTHILGGPKVTEAASKVNELIRALCEQGQYIANQELEDLHEKPLEALKSSPMSPGTN